MEKQTKVQTCHTDGFRPYKDPLKYKVKQVLSFLPILVVVAVMALGVYYLVINQDSILEFTKYIITQIGGYSGRTI